MLIVKLNGINFRLGNLILIILRVISANILFYKHHIISIEDIKHRNNIVLKNFPNFFYFDEFENNDTIIESDFFNDQNYNNLSNDQKEYILNNYIKRYIDYYLYNYDSLNINFDCDLIIHIRSGDIFDKDNDFNKYINTDTFRWFVQPPYSFYEKIINENKYYKIFILSETDNNPIIQKLLKNYNNVYFHKNDIETDFKILLNSKNLVSSTSDFVLSAVYLSNSKNIIYTSRENYFYYVSYKFNIKKYNYSDYYNLPINSYEEKINLMLNN